MNEYDQRQSIAIVTNDDAVTTLYSRLIKSHIGADVTVAKDKASLLEKLRSNTPPDLVIIDLEFEKETGEAIAFEIRSDHNFDRTPIMAITRDSRDGSASAQLRLLSKGVNDYVERTAAQPVFVARTKTQLRHKVALDRIAAMACERDVFAAGVLHDIRNIETSILAICEFTRRKLNKDPVANREQILELLQTLNNQASRLGKYAADVIESVRATRHDLLITAQPIAPLIDWVAAVVGKDATPGFTWNHNSPLTDVLADQAFLKLVLLNVLQNAVKYRRPDTETVISVSQETLGNRVITRLRDNGKGIPASELRKVFEPFTRGSSSDPKDKGTGLGLSLVTRVVNKMNGRVWAEAPATGPGAIICIDLPKA